MSKDTKTALDRFKERVEQLRALIVRDTLVRGPGFDDEVLSIVHEEEYFFEDEALDPNDKEVQMLHKEITHLKSLVFKDELTDVLNRRGFYEKYTALFKDALYAKEHPDAERESVLHGFAIVFVDADNFKSINDAHGHDEGDRVLQLLAETLIAEVRETDAIARFGGEEFVAVLLNTDEDTAYAKAEKIRKSIIKKVVLSSDSDWKVTASIGIAALSHSDADTLDELIGYADQAMYEAKMNRGKNTVIRHSELT